MYSDLGLKILDMSVFLQGHARHPGTTVNFLPHFHFHLILDLTLFQQQMLCLIWSQIL